MVNSNFFFRNTSNHESLFIYITCFANKTQNMLYMNELPLTLSSTAWMGIKISCIKETFGYV